MSMRQRSNKTLQQFESRTHLAYSRATRKAQIAVSSSIAPFSVQNIVPKYPGQEFGQKTLQQID